MNVKTIFLSCMVSLSSLMTISAYALNPTPDQIEAVQAMSPAERQRLAAQFGVKLQSTTTQSSAPTRDEESVQPRDASREGDELRNNAVQYDGQRYNSDADGYGEEEYNSSRGNMRRYNQNRYNQNQYYDENYDVEGFEQERYGADAYYNEQIDEENNEEEAYERDTSVSNPEYESENYQYERYNSDQYNPSPINPANPYNAYETPTEQNPNSNNFNRPNNSQPNGNEFGNNRNSNSTVSPTGSPSNKFPPYGTEPSSFNQGPRNQDTLNQNLKIQPFNQNSQTIQSREMQRPYQQYSNEFTDPNNSKFQKNKTQLDASKHDLKKDPNLKYLRQRLKPFGYELFAGSPSTFAPVTNVPVPAEYVIGPGDTVLIQFYGKENTTEEIVVDREGSLRIPNIGPINVIGMNFRELKKKLNKLIDEQMIGVKATISMGALRSIRVFVLGEAYRPGTYTISSLSNITNAIFASGGVTKVASLRNIQLKRQGKIISTLDLYDLLIKGDTTEDVRLLPGDVIFIPPVGQTVAVRGEVQRPAIYEIKDQLTARELVKLAGGYTPAAYPKASRVDRVSASGERTVVDQNLKTGDLTLKNGDILQIYPVLKQVEDSVVLRGHVDRPGGFTWRAGLKVTDVIPSVDVLKPNPDLSFALLRRVEREDGYVTTYRIELGRALSAPSSSANLSLKPRDEIIVMNYADNNATALRPIVRQLRMQTPVGEFPKIATIRGTVKFPGVYPLTQSMTFDDLVSASGGAFANSDRANVLIARRDPKSTRVTVRRLDVTQPAIKNMPIMPRDEVYIFAVNEDRQYILQQLIWSLKIQADKTEDVQVVSVQGAVKFPGDYPLLTNMDINDLLALAGGLAESAYSLSAEITRRELLAGDEYRVNHMTIDLAKNLNTPLFSRDVLVIKQISNWQDVFEVKLEGEVNFPGIYPIKAGETLSQIIVRAGGLKDSADPRAAIFLRESLKEREAEIIQRYRKQINEAITQSNEKNKIAEEELAELSVVGTEMLSQLESAEPSGRLVINLPAILKDKDYADIEMRDGDRLIVPRQIQEISVLGEVQQTTAHLYQRRHNAKYYIDLSGGFSRVADESKTYIIARDGSVEPFRKRFLFIPIYKKVDAGDTIVVPRDIDPTSPLIIWGQVSRIVFQLATTAAALQTVGAI